MTIPWACLASLWVDGVEITADGGTASCGNLPICPTSLVQSQPHRFAITDSAAPAATTTTEECNT